MHPELGRLMERYPLSSQWTQPELYLDSLAVDHFRMDYAGLVSQNLAGVSITGSAASGKEPTDVAENLKRAYFELLERTSIIEAERNQSETLLLRSWRGEPCGTVARPVLFPKSSEPDLWRYAKSNGVAAHLTWGEACRAAALELIERDRVLGSWHGESCPAPLSLSSELIHPDLRHYYDFKAYRLGVLSTKEELGKVTVVAVIGFPRRAEAPRIGGYAARTSEEAAVVAATRECLQCMSFLWGESIPAVAPEFAPSPEYHQELFLTAPGVERLRRWLDGSHMKYRAEKGIVVPEIRFLDITPPHLVSKVFVVKAYCPDLRPLTFGSCRRLAPEGFPEELLVHPVT